MKQVWTRATEGPVTVLLGAPIPVATTEGLRPLRVPCDLPRGPLGPLLEAQNRARRQLGRVRPDSVADRVRTGLRRTLLGETAPEDALAEIVSTLNQLQGAAGTPRALVLEPVEAADPATIAALIRLVERPGWLKLPLVLGFRDKNPAGPAAALVTAVERACGPDAILRVGADDADDADDAPKGPSLPPDLAPPLRRVLRAAALAGPAFELRVVAELLRQDELDVLDLLQSAVDAGVPLEDDGEGGFRLPAPIAERLRAELLPSLARAWHRALAGLFDPAEPAPPSPRRPTGPVAIIAPRAPAPSAAPGAIAPEAIWTAVIADVPREAPSASLEASLAAGRGVEGAGAAAVASGVASGSMVSDSTMASATLASGARPNRRDDADDRYAAGIERKLFDSIESPFGSVDQAPGAPRNPSRAITDGPGPLMEDEAIADDSVEQSHPDIEQSFGGVDGGLGSLDGGLADALFHRAEAADAAASGLRDAALAGAGLDPAPQGAPRRRREARDPNRQTDAARAADHLAAAGDPTGATAKLIQAAVDAAALGAAEQALAIIDDALAALDRLPDTAEHRALRARALAEAARVQWTGVGPDARFTLEAAREAAAAAEAALPDDAPATLRGEIASLRAHILHDVGGDALEEALALLTAASRRLEALGEPIEAARLFNDQAAIWVRLGDPVRAHGLLEASRKVFAARADHDPLARLELADTEHLIARLPLHVAARAGRERDAAALGLRHAASAEASYAALDRPWDQARTWETLGRLELMRGRVDRAIEHLERAAAAQQQLGDVLGLAATVEALARALTAAGRPQVAIALLHDSLALNAEKGSLQGIGYLRRTVQALADALPPEHRHAMRGLLAEFAAEMRRVEEALQPG